MCRALIVAAVLTLHIPSPALGSDDISQPDRWTAGLHIPVYVYASAEWHAPIRDTLDDFAALGYRFELVEVGAEIDPCPFVEVGIVYCSAYLPGDSWQGVSTPTIVEAPFANAVRVTFNRAKYLDPDRLDPSYFAQLARHETAHALGFGHDRIDAAGMPTGLGTYADAPTRPGKAPSRVASVAIGSAAIITGRAP